MSGPSPQRTYALIAGGGTAGHLLPGLAVADELVRRGHERPTLHFVGAARGPEAELVPAAGYEVTLLGGRGLQRRLTLDNVAAAWGLLSALVGAFRLVRHRRPQVVLSLGGFASAACAVSAVLCRVPLVVAEQNARAGAANRLVGRFATAAAVPFPDTDLPRAVVTGNPVRAEILEVGARRDREAARGQLGLPPDRTVIVVFAGSLGSRRINEATYDLAAAWSSRRDVAIHHVVGARDWEQRREVHTDGLWYQAVRYESRMDLALAAADLAVCRSGGTTVAELAVVGVPSVLVPLPIATRDHQRANAAPLVRAGAAVLIDDDELDGDRLRAEVEPLLDTGGSNERLARMGAAARALGRPDAAAAVADLVERAAAGGGRR